MSELLFCYCCRQHHRRDEMRLFRTAAGYRWRCRRSIEAASRSVRERDAFGRRQTAINLDTASQSLARAVRPNDLWHGR